jgi:hypothetical protein
MTDRPSLGWASKTDRGKRQSARVVEPVPGQAVETKRPKRDRDDCPDGYDQSCWSLALLFRERARVDGIELAHGLPVLHDEIKDLVERHGIRGKSFQHEYEGCERRTLHTKLAAHCWLHYPPLERNEQKTGSITWVEMIEVIILEFWSCYRDQYALDSFRHEFQKTGQQALSHWHSLRQLRAIRANPRPSRPVQHRHDGATMQDASKEG